MARLATITLIFLMSCSEVHDRRNGGSNDAAAESGDSTSESKAKKAIDSISEAEKKTVDERFFGFIDSAKTAPATQLPTVVSQDVLSATMELAEQYNTSEKGVASEVGRCFIATSNAKIIDDMAKSTGLVVIKGTEVTIVYTEDLKAPEDCSKPFADAMGDKYQVNLSQFYTSFFSYRYN